MSSSPVAIAGTDANNVMLFSSFLFVPKYFDGKRIILIHSFPISFMQTSRVQRDFFSWSIFYTRLEHYRFWPNSSFYYNHILKCQSIVHQNFSPNHYTEKFFHFSFPHSSGPKEKKKGLFFGNPKVESKSWMG